MKLHKIVLTFCLILFFAESKAQQFQVEKRFQTAYNEIVDMLEGKVPLSIKRSVFLAEWAYLDGELDYEKDICVPLAKGAKYMQRLIAANQWNRYKTAKQIAICN